MPVWGPFPASKLKLAQYPYITVIPKVHFLKPCPNWKLKVGKKSFKNETCGNFYYLTMCYIYTNLIQKLT